MAVLEIVKYPAKVLLQRAEEVREVDGALQKQIDKMIETLYAAPGLGLAAPQVGDSRRFFVYDLSVQEEEPVARKGPLVVLNPEILEMEGKRFPMRVAFPSRAIMKGETGLSCPSPGS